MTDPNRPAENVEVKIYTPGEEPVIEIINPTSKPQEDETDGGIAATAYDRASAARAWRNWQTRRV